MYYILQGHEPVRVDSIEEWGAWWAKADRRVRKSRVLGVGEAEAASVEVSTVFLALDHQHGKGPPLLFETMIFGGEHDQYQTRCTTWDEAEAMHKKAEGIVLASMTTAVVLNVV